MLGGGLRGFNSARKCSEASAGAPFGKLDSLGGSGASFVVEVSSRIGDCNDGSGTTKEVDQRECLISPAFGRRGTHHNLSLGGTGYMHWKKRGRVVKTEAWELSERTWR